MYIFKSAGPVLPPAHIHDHEPEPEQPSAVGLGEEHRGCLHRYGYR